MTAQAKPMRFRGDFTRFANSTTLPPGYFRTRFASAGATIAVQNNALRLVSGTVTDFTGGIRTAIRPSHGMVDNFSLYVRGKPTTSGFGSTYFPAVTWRAAITDDPFLAPPRAYLLSFASTGVSILRQMPLGGGAVTPSGGNGVSTATFTSGILTNEVFHARVAVRGDHMMARAWRDGEPEPTNWPARCLDNTHPRKGEMQAWMRGGSATNAVIEYQELTIEELPIPDDPVNSDVTGATYRYTTASPTIPESIGRNVAVFNAATQSQTPTLPHPALLPGRPFLVKREQGDTSANTVVLGVPAGVTIDGAANLTLTRGDALMLSPDGGNSYLITGAYA